VACHRAVTQIIYASKTGRPISQEEDVSVSFQLETENGINFVGMSLIAASQQSFRTNKSNFRLMMSCYHNESSLTFLNLTTLLHWRHALYREVLQLSIFVPPLLGNF
jgi:hypothetical protein